MFFFEEAFSRLIGSILMILISIFLWRIWFSVCLLELGCIDSRQDHWWRQRQFAAGFKLKGEVWVLINFAEETFWEITFWRT